MKLTHRPIGTAGRLTGFLVSLWQLWFPVKYFSLHDRVGLYCGDDMFSVCLDRCCTHPRVLSLILQDIQASLPLFAGDDPDLLALAMWSNEPCLPPLIIGGIDDMQDVSVQKAETLAGQATVPSPVVIKQSPAEWRIGLIKLATGAHSH